MTNNHKFSGYHHIQFVNNWRMKKKNFPCPYGEFNESREGNKMTEGQSKWTISRPNHLKANGTVPGYLHHLSQSGTR